MPGGVVKKSAGSGMLGVLMGDASATDELAAAAVGMKLLKKLLLLLSHLDTLYSAHPCSRIHHQPFQNNV